MSTSYRTLFPPSAAAPVESFRYAEAQGTDSMVSGATPDSAEGVDDVAQLLLRSHAEGVREGAENERARAKQQLDQERAKITEAILHFQTSVTDYFSRTETEVVQLALAIAAKILHREAQADPMLGSKLTKEVLKSLHQQTKVRVRVPAEQVERWRNELSAHDDGRITLDVISDDSVPSGNCVLETELGKTEVGLVAQLREIENGMLDLLAHSPDRP